LRDHIRRLISNANEDGSISPQRTQGFHCTQETASKVLDTDDLNMKLENHSTSGKAKLVLKKKGVRERLENEDRRVWK
jgi:hypothetical protein